VKVAALLVVALLATAAWAQVYHWVDDQGVVHYTTGIESVPEKYRATARSMPVSGVDPVPPAPSTASGSGTTIPFTPGAPILVSARINGGSAITLVLDTGADRTLVAPAVLVRLGITLPNTLEATIRGVAGTIQADVVSIQSLEVGNIGAGPMSIIAHDAELPGADGLLGRDFLSLFSMTIDSRTSVVTLEPN
jgi:hypothetical protein